MCQKSLFTGFILCGALIASSVTSGQIITLEELSTNFNISDVVRIHTSGSYRLTKSQALDKAVSAEVSNSFSTVIDNVDLTVLICRNLQTLKKHIETMGSESDFGQSNVWTYTEDTSPDSAATDEQFITFNQPIRRHNKENRKKKDHRKKGILVDTIYHGTVTLPASDSIELLKGKNIKIPAEAKSGIYHLAIVLARSEKSGMSTNPRVQSIHYLVVHDDPQKTQP